MMKLTTVTLCFAVIGAVTLGAQKSETTTKTKVEVKDGKDVTLTGCVQANPGGGYLLTNVADKDGSMHRYMLVSDDQDFSKHVGHRMTIQGKAADRGHGKVEIERKTKTEGEDRDKTTKAESRGDLSGTGFLGVKSMAMVATSCP